MGDPSCGIVWNASLLECYLLALGFLYDCGVFPRPSHHARQRNGFGRAGGNGVDAHAERREFQCPAAGDVLQRRLAVSVSGACQRPVTTNFALGLQI